MPGEENSSKSLDLSSVANLSPFFMKRQIVESCSQISHCVEFEAWVPHKQRNVLWVSTAEESLWHDLTTLNRWLGFFPCVIFLTGVEEGRFERLVERTCIKVEAGGSLLYCVSGGKSYILFIKRHSAWDMPKGKIEGGESPVACAVREAQEEVGVPLGTAEGTYLATTRHFYFLGMVPHLKVTHWFVFEVEELVPPTPQKEEGIELARWIPLEEARSMVRGGAYWSVLWLVEMFLSHYGQKVR